MIKSNNVCNNCGKIGHLFHHCKLPITSYGIVLFRSSNEGIQYLMIRRKDSFGYVDFIKGKYNPLNLEQLQLIINEMSNEEKVKILTYNFEELWKDLWCSNVIQYRNDDLSSMKKFELIKNGVNINNNNKVTLKDLVDKSNTTWHETEWEFPKGRRNYQEKDLECALREFEEETGCSKDDIDVVNNIFPFEEIFVGSNFKTYKTKYFLAYMKKTNTNMDNYQKSEVSKLEWKSFDDCLKSIRPYNLEKKKLINNINKVLQEYSLYI